jgi:hypothetical protein
MEERTAASSYRIHKFRFSIGFANVVSVNNVISVVDSACSISGFANRPFLPAHTSDALSSGF